MKAKKYWILALVVVCCAVFLSMMASGVSPLERAQLQSFQTPTLHNLRGVCLWVCFVVIEEDGKRAKTKLGLLSEEDLQTQVELALRKIGIKIAERPDPKEKTALLQVFVKASPVGEKKLLYQCVVQAELIERVELIRDAIHTEAPTWPYLPSLEISTFVAGSLRVEQAIRDEVDNKINEFCNDYLAANPKEQPTEEKGKKTKND